MPTREADSFPNQTNADLDRKNVEYLAQDPSDRSGVNVSQRVLDERYMSSDSVLSPTEKAWLDSNVHRKLMSYGGSLPTSAHPDTVIAEIDEETNTARFWRRTSTTDSDTLIGTFTADVAFASVSGSTPTARRSVYSATEGQAAGMSPSVVSIETDGRGGGEMIVDVPSNVIEVPSAINVELTALDGTYAASIRFRRRSAFVPAGNNVFSIDAINPAEPVPDKAYSFAVLNVENENGQDMVMFQSASAGWTRIVIGGSDGENGWTPVLAVVSDSARRVLQVDDWTGGSGTKPDTGRYVGPSGLVAAIGDAVDIRGPAGGAGPRGPSGQDAPGIGRRIGKTSAGKIALATSLTGNQSVTIRRLA